MKKFTLIMLVLFFSLHQYSYSQGGKDVVEVANIEELYEQEADNSTVYLIMGEVIITHQHGQRNQKFVQDNTAAIIIDDSQGIITTQYNLYDGITELKGKLSLYNSLLQLIPTEDPGEATSTGNLVEPLVITFNDLDTTYQSMLVRINEVDFDTELETLNPSTNYDVFDPTGTCVIRTPSQSAQLDYFGTEVPNGTRDMIAIVSQFNDVVQIFPRSLEDIYLNGVPTFVLSFSIINEAGDDISDAIITFDDITYGEGEYMFDDVIMGSHSYSVERVGFYTRSGTIIISDDMEKEVILVEISDNVVEDFPWSEGFEESVPPSTWNHYAFEGGGWQSTSIANSGSSAAFHNFITNEACDSWLVTPQISIPEEGKMLLKFFERNGLMGDYEYSGVKISRGSGNPLQQEFVEVYESASSINTYTQKIVDLSSYAGSVIYIAFVYQGENAHQWYIDDVYVEEAPQAIEVENIAALRQQDQGTLVYHLTGEVILTHQHGQRNQKYIQDSSGAIVIDDYEGIITTEYNLYDAIAGIKGTLNSYNQLLQFIPVEDPGNATSSGNLIEPVQLTLIELATEHQSMLVYIENVEFDTDDFNFATSKSYNIFDPSGTGILRTPNASAGLDYFGTPIPTKPVHMVALVTQFNADMQIFPRSLADIIATGNSVEVNNQELISMYPNPFNDYIRIDSYTVIRQIVIYNVLGQVVKNIENPLNSMQISTGDLNQGLYIVCLISNDGVKHAIKMVKR